MNTSMLRTRWAAIGAAVAVTLGAGGLATTYATSPAGAVAFVPITPCRVLDTRPAPDNVGNRATPIGAGKTFTVTAHGSNGNCTGGSAIPTGATGLELNVTALGATSGTFLTIWAQGATQPTASNLNPQPGAPPTPNSVTTGLSGTGQFNIFNAAGFVNVLVDVVGYYTDHSHDDRYYTKPEVDAALAPLTTASTSTLTLAGNRFQPTASALTYSPIGGAVYATALPGAFSFIAELDLPAGAAITAVTFYVVDNDATDLGLSLRSYDPSTGITQTLASASSTGAAATGQSIVVTLDPPVVVDPNVAYRLRVAPGVATSAHLLRGARVVYTVPAALPAG